VTAVPFDDAVADREAESGPAVRAAGVCPVKGGEDRGVLSGRDADSAVSDLDMDPWACADVEQVSLPLIGKKRHSGVSTGLKVSRHEWSTMLQLKPDCNVV
jgi:hypothetical protein